MSDPPTDNDPIAQLRKQIAAAADRERIERGPERRQAERRALGFAARRRDDADLNNSRRAFLSDYLLRLPPRTLKLWVDGLWVGRATEAELAVLVQIATAPPEPPPPPRRRRVGRPVTPLVEGKPDALVLDEWVRVHKQIWRELGSKRAKHHAKMNRDRSNRPRAYDWRLQALATPIGQRLQRAGVFVMFFDDRKLSPQETAARLLHAEVTTFLRDAQRTAETRAGRAPTAHRKRRLLTGAQEAARRRKALGTPIRFYDKLRKWTRA